MPTKPPPLVIGGCHRSGTSLLRRVLDSHPQVHCPPELPFFRDLRGDYFDDPLGHLRFATTVRGLLGESQALRMLGAAFVNVHECAAAAAGKRRWADKAPENVLYTSDWTTLLGTDWLFVHMVRHPLDTLASMELAGFPLTLPGRLEERVELYERFVSAGNRFVAAHPARSRVVVYEQLVRDPTVVIGSLMTWLGESFDLRQLDFNAVPHESGLEDPNVGQTTAVHDRSLGRWREVFDDAQASYIWSRTEAAWSVATGGRFG